MGAMFTSLVKSLLPKKPSIIQPAAKSDLPALAEIHSSSFSHAWSDGELEKMLDNDNYICLVARAPYKPGKPPSGFIFVRSILDEAEVITIATKPSARRKGVARQLMHAAIRQLQHDRGSRLFLEVDALNEAAVRLYKTLGFKQVGTREGYYPDSSSETGKTSTALVMQLELG